MSDFTGSIDILQQQLNISHAETERREQELSILNEIGLIATQMLDLEEILKLGLDTMVTKLGMECALIYLWDEISGRYTLQASRGVTKKQIEEIDRRRDSGHDITQEVVNTGREVFVANMASDVRFKGVWDNLQGRSYVKLPLLSRGMVVGVLGLVTPAGYSLNLRAVEFLKAVGREIGIAIDNAILLAETRRREQQAVTLYELGVQISASLSLNSVLNAVAQAAKELTDADIGLVGLMDEGRREVVIQADCGCQTEAFRGLRVAMREGSPWSVLIGDQPILLEADQPDQFMFHDKALIADESIASMLAVPLRRGEIFMGFIEVLSRQPARFLPRDARLLERLGHQVAVAIENALLYRQLHHFAALEERDRLARELHDHLAQGLGYLKVKAAITEDLMANGQLAQAQESLLELKKASQMLYTDVREEIFNLRTAVTEQEGFFSTLRDYLADYRTHYGLNVHLVIENECLSDFSPEVAGQLLRIIQEALTNVRRHSNAGKVLIHCAQGGDQVCIRIEDDGRGFCPDEVTKENGQHVGLQIMRERAESVGGSLMLDSLPGKGTRVIVKVPSMQEM